MIWRIHSYHRLPVLLTQETTACNSRYPVRSHDFGRVSIKSPANEPKSPVDIRRWWKYSEGGGSELVMCRDDQRTERQVDRKSSERTRLVKVAKRILMGDARCRFLIYFWGVLPASPRIPVGDDGRGDWRLEWCSGTGVSRRKPMSLYLLSRLFLLLELECRIPV